MFHHPGQISLVSHIDKINDDNSRQISKPHLSGDLLRRLKIAGQDGVPLPATRLHLAGIDIDHIQSFRLFNDDIAPAGKPDGPGTDFFHQSGQIAQLIEGVFVPVGVKEGSIVCQSTVGSPGP